MDQINYDFDWVIIDLLCWFWLYPHIPGTLFVCPLTVKMSVRHCVAVPALASGSAISKVIKSSLPFKNDTIIWSRKNCSKSSTLVGKYLESISGHWQNTGQPSCTMHCLNCNRVEPSTCCCVLWSSRTSKRRLHKMKMELIAETINSIDGSFTCAAHSETRCTRTWRSSSSYSRAFSSGYARSIKTIGANT